MKKTKKLLVLLLTILTLAVLGTATALANGVKPTKVTRITSSAKTITVGTVFELKAKIAPVNAEDDYLRWSIIGQKGIIKFANNDRNDDEVEFKALKAGTTKVRCSIKGKSTAYSKTFTVTVKKASTDTSFSRITSQNVKVELGDDIDLKVKMGSGLKNRDLKWTIKDTRILKFDDGDCYGKEVEVKGKKPGKTTVTCKNLKTNKTITFTVQVVPDTEDDDDWDD